MRELVISLYVRVLSMVLAGFLVVASVVVLLEVCAGWIGRGTVVLPKDFSQSLRLVKWTEPAPLIVFATMLVLGIGSLIGAFGMRKPHSLQTRASEDFQVERAPLNQVFAHRLEQIEGVSSVSVKTNRRGVVVGFESNRAMNRQLVEETVRTQLIADLDRFDLPLAAKVTLLASPKEKKRKK